MTHSPFSVQFIEKILNRCKYYTVNAVALQLIKLSYQIKAVMPGFSAVRLSSCSVMNFVDVLFFGRLYISCTLMSAKWE